MDYKKIFLVSLGHLSCDVNAHALPALLPYLAAAYHFDYQTCGLLAFAYSAFASLIQPLMGLMADKVSRSWFVPFGVLLAGIGFGITGLLSHEAAIFAALALAGLGSAFFHPEGARYANLVSGNQKGVGLSIFAVGGNGGMVFGPMLVIFAVTGFTLGDFKIGGFGLKGTLVFTLLGVIMSALLFRAISAWDMSSLKTQKKKSMDGAVNDWRSFGFLFGLILCRACLAIGLPTYIPLYWQRVFGQSAETGSMVLVVFCIAGVLCNLSGGAAADRFGYSRVIRGSSLIALPCIALFPFIRDPWIALLLLLPIAIGLFGSFSPMVVLGQRYLAKNVAFASGITLGVAGSAGGLFVPILGWLADMWGGLAPAMHLLTPLAVAQIVFSLLLKDNKPAKA